jgi:hypothetical protein
MLTRRHSWVGRYCKSIEGRGGGHYCVVRLRAHREPDAPHRRGFAVAPPTSVSPASYAVALGRAATTSYQRFSACSRLSANPICLSPLIVLRPTLGLGVGGIGECAAD